MHHLMQVCARPCTLRETSWFFPKTVTLLAISTVLMALCDLATCLHLCCLIQSSWRPREDWLLLPVFRSETAAQKCSGCH